MIQIILLVLGFTGTMSWAWVFGLCWAIEILEAIVE